jgi:hypothetical protein
MPIRFRCVYCDKLLGIARRKAGAVVNCPQCGQPLIVPTPESEPVTAAASAPPSPAPKQSKLFEREDFDALLRGDATLRTSEADDRPSRKARRPSANPLPPRPFPVERSLPAPDDRDPTLEPPRPATRSGIILSTGMLVLFLAATFVLIGIAFGGGIVVGRMLH